MATAEQPPAPQPVQQAAQGPPPVLREGYIQGCQGYLKRRTKFLKRWKKQWFSVVPGPQNHEIVQHGKRRTSLHSFPTANPNIAIEPLSADPRNKDFLAFRVVNRETQEEMSRFRAKDIVQMRRFMASLGGTGEGLFTKKTDDGEVPIEATHGLWDVIHPSEDELIFRQQFFDNQTKKPEGDQDVTRPPDAPPTYMATVQQLPVGFYFPEDTGVDLPADVKRQLAFPGTSIPVFDPAAPLPKSIRRPWHDTFRPPNGPPVFFPVSIGYGAEVGLENGLQALWDPVGKTYFFLDHIRKVTFYEDPRPPRELPPVVQLEKCAYGDQRREGGLPSDICTDPSVIEATTKRALSKPHGHVLYACGVHGAHGPNGETGATGATGSHGSHGGGYGGHGGRGGPGHPGSIGTPGARGQDATEASDVILNIYGDPSELQVSGTCTFTANLGGMKAEEVLHVTCRGGDGGNGGRGGDGGRGGRGGHGGSGANGRPGMSSSTGSGGNGGPGGDGGDGGMGGPGGSGARGGDGGHAGFGGVCIIQAADPNLLVLVEADCKAGRPGTGGDGGSGGAGGDGGSGGSGGHGGSGGSGGSRTDSQGHTTHYSSGMSGRSGSSGRRGPDGPRGPNGARAIDGNTARDGGILWVVSAPDGGVLYQAGTRYDAEVTNFHVVSAIDDGIFEPNERIMVSGVLVVNSGGLPLPAGSSAFIPSTKTVKFEPTRFEMPEMVPTQSFVIPITYYGRIFDQPPPNVPGPFVSSAEFHPRIELLGRPFEKSFLQQKLTVQYPVKLAYLRSSENLGRGEVSVLEIGVQNISSMPYGGCQGSGGRVTLQVHLDARLIPVGSSNVGISSVPYTVTFDPNIQDSLYVEMHEIPAGGTVIVQINVQMESRAELFDRCYWQADLYLRDKLIEYNYEKIRVSPFYVPKDPPADVLMVTDSSITRKEFVFWQRMLESMKVSVVFWDIERYNGFSVDRSTNTRHQVTWEGRYTGRMILFPHCKLDTVWGIDIVRHFHGPNYRDGPLEDLNSSFVAFMAATPPHTPQADPYHDRGDLAFIRHLAAVDGSIEIPEDAYSGRHMMHPGSCFVSATPHLKWEKKRLKKLEKETPNQSHAVLARHVHIQSAGTFRYNYGSVDIRRFPLLRSCKLMVIDGAGGSMVDMSLDDLNLSPRSREIPLASNFGQVLLATLFGIPLRCKVALLRKEPEEVTQSPEVRFTFYLPSGYTLTKYEIIVIAIAAEVADEVYNCAGTSRRMGQLAEAIQEDAAAFADNGRVILRGLNLIEDELKDRKKNISNAHVSRAINDIKHLASNVKRALCGAGVDDHDLEPLLRFQLLQDGQRVHCSHQHRVKDGRWNLTGDTH